MPTRTCWRPSPTAPRRVVFVFTTSVAWLAGGVIALGAILGGQTRRQRRSAPATGRLSRRHRADRHRRCRVLLHEVGRVRRRTARRCRTRTRPSCFRAGTPATGSAAAGGVRPIAPVPRHGEIDLDVRAVGANRFASAPAIQRRRRRPTAAPAGSARARHRRRRCDRVARRADRAPTPLDPRRRLTGTKIAAPEEFRGERASSDRRTHRPAVRTA